MSLSVFSLIAWLVLPTHGAHQQDARRLWYQSYDLGLRSLQLCEQEQSECDVAVGNLLAAKQDGPEPGRRVRFQGDAVRAFNPDFYLGRAYLQLGQFERAANAFQLVEESGLIVEGDPDYAAFVAQALRARLGALLGTAAAQLDAGNATGAEETLKLATSLGLREDDERLVSLRDIITEARAEAQAPLSRGPEYGAPQTGDSPDDSSNSGGGRATNSDEEPTQAVVVAREEEPTDLPVESTIGTTERPSERSAPISLPDPQSLDRANEHTALVAYFSGDYSSAYEMLGAVSMREEATPRTFLFYACSIVAMVLVGEAQERALDEARRQFARAGSVAGPEFARDRSLISPRVLDLLGAQP